MHLIVAPQLSGGWQHNYLNKTSQKGHANEQSIYSRISMANPFVLYHPRWPRKLITNYCCQWFHLRFCRRLWQCKWALNMCKLVSCRIHSLNVSVFKYKRMHFMTRNVSTIEMKGITRWKLTIISESAVCKKFLGQNWSYTASQ